MASLLLTPERGLLCTPLAERDGSAPGVPVGALVSLVDYGASDPALAAVRPDWTATQHLSIHGAGPMTDGPIVVDTNLVRVGSRSVVVKADVYDGHGTDDFEELQRAIDRHRTPGDEGELTLTARGLVAFSRITGRAAPAMGDYDPASWVGEVRHGAETELMRRREVGELGARVVDAASGVLELERSPRVTNSIGTIFGGVQALLTEAAVEAFRPGLRATDMHIHFLSQVRAGPVRTSVSLTRDDDDHSVVDVELVDAGNEDALLTLATVLLEPGVA